MAIFGNKKKKEATETNVRRHRARTTVSADGLGHEIIQAPWFSEKALIATEKGVYAFEVSLRATKAEIAAEEERIQKYSTGMYRSPEMADLYKRELINEKVDIWVP